MITGKIGEESPLPNLKTQEDIPFVDRISTNASILKMEKQLAERQAVERAKRKNPAPAPIYKVRRREYPYQLV
jgi:hypothetical protein